MKHPTVIVFSIFFAIVSQAEPPELKNPLTIQFGDILKVVKKNVNGWTKLRFDDGKTLFTPNTFYTEKISNAEQWVNQIRKMGFCEPDRVWKNFPVLSVSNDQLASSFEQAALDPAQNVMMQMNYYETVLSGGKSRNISYHYTQAGSDVKITCSAANELGQVQTIQQAFDVHNPKKFNVEQKRNGKLLEI